MRYSVRFEKGGDVVWKGQTWKERLYVCVCVITRGGEKVWHYKEGMG